MKTPDFQVKTPHPTDDGYLVCYGGEHILIKWLPNNSDVCPLCAILKALRTTEKALYEAQAELDRLRGEVTSLRTFKRGVDEALNTGSGVYKP